MSTLSFSEYSETPAASPSLSSHAFTVCPIEREQKGVSTQVEKPGMEVSTGHGGCFPSPGERCPQNTPKKRPPAGWDRRCPAAGSAPAPSLSLPRSPPGRCTQGQPARAG